MKKIIITFSMLSILLTLLYSCTQDFADKTEDTLLIIEKPTELNNKQEIEILTDETTPEQTITTEKIPLIPVKTEEEIIEEKIDFFITGMSIEQKVGQMLFHAFRRDITGAGIMKINQNIIDVINNYNLGGVILFSENIESTQQVTDYINDLQEASSLPLFIGIDEEGGRVLRTRTLDVPRISSALSIGNTGDTQTAYNAAKTIAGYLKPLGFNVDFAPVADVFTNPANTVIGDRAFAREATQAAEIVKSFAQGLLDIGVMPTLKHFPGHGDTSEDSHFGIAVTYKTLAELSECEFLPFQAGININVPFIMIGHISTPNITADNLPALFSSYLLQDILRNMLGFDGIIITDSLSMGAVTKYYNSEETAVKAILAGVDILLIPENVEEAFNGIIKALESGEITQARINESVKRILTAKYNAGMIELPDV